MRKILFISSLILLFQTSFSQSGSSRGGGAFIDSETNLLGQNNTITTSVPFLLIAPESRAGAMGEVGAATAPDLNSQHWNPAKYAFLNKDMGFSVSYTPWLKGLVNDINLAYLSGFYKVDDNQTVSGSLVYFSLGDITFTDDKGSTIAQATPNEFAIDGAYSRKLSQYISGGLALRYIFSDLTNGVSTGTGESKPGQSVAADVSTYYQRDIDVSKMPSVLSFGLDISNIGAKISYSNNAEKDFLPTNLRLGAGLKMNLDDYNSLFITADVNKLLVPTQPVYYEDSVDAEGNQVIKYGKDPKVSLPLGMIQSFYDAPAGAKEELREIMYSFGAEYWYDKQFALRAGYFHEHQMKGNRKFFTVGFGLKLNVFGLDFAYLIPTQQKHPLENTLRFTLTFDLANFKEQDTPKL